MFTGQNIQFDQFTVALKLNAVPLELLTHTNKNEIDEEGIRY